MLSSVGIYIDKNLIKYAKVKKIKKTYKIESYNVEIFENLEQTLNRILIETDSKNCPVNVNISNEYYNYFETYSELDKKDMIKTINIEFEKICNDSGENTGNYESRFLLSESNSSFEKVDVCHVSIEKTRLNTLLNRFNEFKLFSATPIDISLVNLFDKKNLLRKRVAILNIEEKTSLTLIDNGNVKRVNTLKSNLNTALEKISKIEMSYSKAYNDLKNMTIYNHEVENLNDDENEYLNLVLPVLNNIKDELLKILVDYNISLDELYISGMGAMINNIDIFFQDYFRNSKVEILIPYFIDKLSLKNPIKEYIEINSAIALALNVMNIIKQDINFAPYSAIDIEKFKFVRDEIDMDNFKEEVLEKPITETDKMLLRVTIIAVLLVIIYIVFSMRIGGNIKKNIDAANDSLGSIANQTVQANKYIEDLNEYSNLYSSIISTVDSSEKVEDSNSRIIDKDAIPNLLNQIMFVIPQNVTIESMQNTEDKHIVIKAKTENKDSSLIFYNAINDNNLLKNVKYNIDTENNSDIEITIEGDL